MGKIYKTKDKQPIKVGSEYYIISPHEYKRDTYSWDSGLLHSLHIYKCKVIKGPYKNEPDWDSGFDIKTKVKIILPKEKEPIFKWQENFWQYDELEEILFKDLEKAKTEVRKEIAEEINNLIQISNEPFVEP